MYLIYFFSFQLPVECFARPERAFTALSDGEL